MIRLIFLFLPFFAGLTIAAFGEENRPHVVILVSDDMGWNDVGYHGGAAETPHIDSLARDGLELDRFYVHPICTPTRVALMTGRLPARFGLTGPLSFPSQKGIPRDEVTLSEVFHSSGYETAVVGKWHLGDAAGDQPLSRGFDHFYGHLSGMIDYFEHTNRGTHDWQRNGEPIKEEGYSTDLLAAEAERVIESRDDSKPLFLYVPFNAPHGPHQAPEDLIEKYSELGGRGESAVRAACLDSLDQAIGRILGALESNGMKENSLVLFFCDNGSKASRKRPVDEGSGPALRGGKGEVFEGGIRVPAALRWPAKIPAGQKSGAFLSVLDLLPTLTAAVGIPHQSEKPLDGVNRWPALANGAKVADPIVVLGQRGAMTVIQDPLKLIRRNGEEELYDVRVDPAEQEDLSEQRPQDLASMQSLLKPYEELGGRRGKGAASGKKKGKGKGKEKS